MNIFLRRIPANTQHIEISEFVAPALKNGFFRKPGRILNIEILALRDSRVGTIEYHGLVTLDSESTVQRAVNGLKNRRLNGRYVLVRPYHHRSWYNDPRQHRDADDSVHIEKRKGDRRRGRYLDVIKNIPDRFSSESDFFNAMNHRPFMVTFMVPIAIGSAVAESFIRFEQEHGDQGLNDAPERRITRFLTEQDGLEQHFQRFQIYGGKHDISAILDMLKKQFSDAGIHYWIMPVVETGKI